MDRCVINENLYFDRIFLPGQPARVTHQSGIRLSGRHTYKTKALVDWENTLMQGLKANGIIPKKPIEGPIKLEVVFGFKAKRKKDILKWKTTRPDTDNMVKTIKDVMTAMRYWNDDSQVVHESCKKMFCENPGILITIEQLDEADEHKDVFFG